MRKYIFITYDAVVEFTKDRFLQNTGYEVSLQLCRLLKGECNEWAHSKIHISVPTRNEGLLIYTNNVDRKRAFIFDLVNFNGFENNSNERVIMMFQRLLKYAVRYFERLPLVNCEHELPNGIDTIVYPFPFAATKGVERVVVDRNSWKQNRKERDFLTAYYYGHEDNQKFSATIANKALTDFDSSELHFGQSEETKDFRCHTFAGRELCELEQTISSTMLYENWGEYLTIPQRKFIEADVNGAEFLKGAAGTGKTLSLVLRCIHLLRKHLREGTEYHILFIVHSFAAKHRTIDLITQAAPDIRKLIEHHDEPRENVSINISTMQEWCAAHVGLNLQEDNYLDPDASESKQLQLLYIEQAFDICFNGVKTMAESLYSPEFYDFISKKDDSMLEMIRDEVVILIKGKAQEKREIYMEMERPQHGVPAFKDSDKTFLFSVYKNYRDSLNKISQYDTDDIVLTALGSIDTPIWRRIQERDGYDVCFIDETQLFNFNEASVFHHVNKPGCENNIIFTIDQSQAIGTNKIHQEDVVKRITTQAPIVNQLDIVFRSAQGIIDLAYHILSSGSTLFGLEFQNLMANVESSFTTSEEQKSLYPSYVMYGNDEEMIFETFAWVDKYCRDYNVSRSNVLIVATSQFLLNQMQKFASSKNKAYDILTKRYDENQTLIRAQKGNKYIMGEIEYVGGLEFDAVVIVGVDESRVPPKSSQYAAYFERHIWHSKLYVAITRAKYAVHICGAPNEDVSPIMQSAIEEGLVINETFVHN